jgi:cardiolipin synthase
VVVDAKVAIGGGVGIGDDWRAACRARPFRDREVVLRAPVVKDVLGAFAEEWLEATGTLAPVSASADRGAGEADGVPMLALRSRGGTGTSPLEQALRLVVGSARRRARFVDGVLHPAAPAPRRARRGRPVRGARSHRSPGSQSNRALARAAGEAFYAPLLAAGVEIHEYRRAMLHAKQIVVDDGLVAVGSANLHDRALLLDDELVVFAHDALLARELTAEFETDLAESDRVNLSAWRRRPIRRRTREQAALVVCRDL